VYKDSKFARDVYPDLTAANLYPQEKLNLTEAKGLREMLISSHPQSKQERKFMFFLCTITTTRQAFHRREVTSVSERSRWLT
jgi:hypothetical protein